MGAIGHASAQAPLRLTLGDAVERARAASPRLGQLDALARAADAAAAGTTAARRPVLDLAAGYTRQSSVPELVTFIPEQGFVAIYPNIEDNWRTRAQVTLPLYTGGRLERLGDAAAREAEASRADRTAAGADVVLETTVAYWDLVTTREARRVLTEAIAAYDAHLRDAQNRVRFGLAAPNEPLAVQVERDQAELARVRAAADETAVEADLARLIGAPAGVAIETVESLEPPGGTAPSPGGTSPSEGTALPPEPLEELTARALAQRPERVALQQRVRAAEARAAAARAGRRPSVVAAAGYDYSNPNRRLLPATEEWRSSWDAGVSATWSVLDGGRTRSAVAEAEARADAARRGLDDLDARLRLEVTRRVLDLRTAVEAVAVAETSVASARENRRVAEERYRAGVAVSSELLDAETALLRAGLARADALARVRVATAGLRRAVGDS